MHPRETPTGFLLDSREFLVAAEHLLNRANSVSLPAYFLFARCIELSLKAFLLERGMKPKTLGSRAFGHSLSALLNEAVKLHLYDKVPLDSEESAAIELLGQGYLDTRLGYRISGEIYKLPLIEVTEQAAKKLVVGLKSVCAHADLHSKQHKEAI